MRHLTAGASVPDRDSANIIAALNSVADAYNVDPAAIAGMIHTESVWDPTCVTGSYIGLTQVGPELPRSMNLSRDQFLALSAADQIQAYGKWLTYYRYLAQTARYGMNDAILTMRGRLAWAHNYDTDRNIAATFQTLPGVSFVVNGAAQARDAALTTASAEIKWVNGFSLAAAFEGEFSNVTKSYAGKGIARYSW